MSSTNERSEASVTGIPPADTDGSLDEASIFTVDDEVDESVDDDVY